MFVAKIEAPQRPSFRRNPILVAFFVALGFSFAGPSTTSADPARVTAADFVRLPEREVDLEEIQAQDAAAQAARRAAAEGWIRFEQAAPVAPAATSAPAVDTTALPNQHRGVPLE